MFDEYFTSEELKDLREYQNSFSLPVEYKHGRMIILKVSENEHALISYYTHVATVKDGKLYRHWNGWSATTAKHVRELCHRYGLDAPNKHEWLSMDVVPYGSIYLRTL